jgi:hypothetical protein
MLLLAGCVRAGFETPTTDLQADGDAVVDLFDVYDAASEIGALDFTIDNPSRPCVETPDAHTVALYTFAGSGSTIGDATGQHPGAIVGKAVSRVPGRPGCGQAIAFAGAGGYVEIPDSPAWDLATGSFDLWLRIDAMPGDGSKGGVISRDALMQALPGHFSLYVACNGALGARLQTTAYDAFACSATLQAGIWYHVGVNFGAGPLEIYIDGALSTQTAPFTCSALTFKCGTGTTAGIDGNDNPWTVGIASATSDEGLATPTNNPLVGAIDSLRISSARRAFGTGEK